MLFPLSLQGVSIFDFHFHSLIVTCLLCLTVISIPRKWGINKNRADKVHMPVVCEHDPGNLKARASSPRT